ncbi:MAG: beta-class carbonic anhydrase [Promethearchaeota archaeon]
MNDIKEMLLEGNNRYQWKIIQGTERLGNNKKQNSLVLFLTCMDPRIDIHRIFQLNPGDAFILRNAGNIYTEDILRSILIAIHEYSVKNVIVLGHLDCGMPKIQLSRLKNKLAKPALAKICRNGTNIELNLQKFFKIFIDELKNINKQINWLKSLKEIPSSVQIIGLLYDPNSGWVFHPQEFGQYQFIQNFMHDYKKIIEKKRIDLIDYFESIEEEIIGEEIKESIEETSKSIGDRSVSHIEEELIQRDQIEDKVEKRPKENLIKIEKQLTEAYQTTPLSIPKVKIPKIYVPNIKVKIYGIGRKNKKIKSIEK